MATTPGFTGSNFSPKSFWKKPEGTPGMILTVAAAGAGLVGLYFALPFLTTIVWGTVNLVIGGLVLAALAYVVTNGTIQALTRNIFQSICRGIATFYTTIDPIGILKNNLDDMKKAKGQLDQTIQRFSGSDNNLKTNIAKKHDEIVTLGSKVNEANRLATTKTDPLERERITLASQTYSQKAGLLMQAVNQLQALENQTNDMLTKFRHWSQVSDAKIDRTQMQVEIFSEQRKMILDAKSTLSVGQRLLKGDPEQLKLVDGAIEFLAEDAARTLGEIQEFNRFSDKMLTDIDIENGANAELARQKFADFGVKLDAESNRPSAADQLQAATSAAVNSPGFNAQVVSPFTQGAAVGSNVPRQTNTNGGDYNDAFKS